VSPIIYDYAVKDEGTMTTVHQLLLIAVKEVKLPNPLFGSGNVYAAVFILGVSAAKLAIVVIVASARVIKVLVVVKHDDVKVKDIKIPTL
jgi:hypothetical protein